MRRLLSSLRLTGANPWLLLNLLTVFVIAAVELWASISTGLVLDVHPSAEIN
jgi:hypothetical protein